jgi:peptidoglycan pentaglycine glycine transferase (the first glycine)
MPEIQREEWESFFRSHPNASFLQSPSWGDVKEEFGWHAVKILQGDTGAQLLIKHGPLGMVIGYIPKGPLGKITPEFALDLLSVAKKKHCFLVTVEADAWENDVGWITSGISYREGRNIQPRRTIVISLKGSEEEWLARMKQKTRYNIRLAQKKEVAVTESSDIGLFYDLMTATGVRDGFGIHSHDYYQKVYSSFQPYGNCTILLAFFEGRPLGAIMAIAQGTQAWYIYGASNDIERNRMPTYLLQWEAMRWAARKGCETYDLWGIPDEDEETLEAQFENRSDGLWGVYRFKRGFGGEIKRSVQAMDFVINPTYYGLYKRFAGRMHG